MRRYAVLTFVLCVTSITALAQNRLNGNWATERLTDPTPISDAQRRQSVQLELNIESAKASGTISLGGLGGNFYTFNNASVNGNKVQFRMDPSNTGAWSTWTIELVDENTVLISRGSIEFVGNNVLDRLPVLESRPPLTPVASVAAVTSPPASGTATIRGVVQDPSKAIIPGVTVIATNIDTGAKLMTTTGYAGYAFQSVPPGTYMLSASLAGFNTTTLSGLTVGTAEFKQDLTLELRTAQTPTVSSCGQNGIVWCSVLHRTK